VDCAQIWGKNDASFVLAVSLFWKCRHVISEKDTIRLLQRSFKYFSFLRLFLLSYGVEVEVLTSILYYYLVKSSNHSVSELQTATIMLRFL